MSFFGAIKSCYGKIFTFSGRAPRSEYWWFVLYQCLVGLGLWAGGMAFALANPQLVEQLKSGAVPPADFALVFGAVSLAHFLLFFMPGLSVLVRRLHDTGRSGWWYFITMIPLIGAIWLLVLLCLPGSNGRNGHGPDPLGHRRRFNDHPALMGEMDPEMKAALRERQQADFREYYQSRVLPSIERNKQARGA